MGVCIGLISLAVAGWALKASIDARNAIAIERRHAFELSVLHELARALDEDKIIARVASCGRELRKFEARMLSLHGDPLPNWWHISHCDTEDDARGARRAVRRRAQGDRRARARVLSTGRIDLSGQHRSVQPVIAPAPPTPATSASTAPPTPVIVVDDPGPDWVAVVGLFLSALASAVAIYLSWRAVEIGKLAAAEARKANTEASKARASVAKERRRTFELEVLRGLLETLDENGSLASDLIAARGEGPDTVAGRMALLGNDELPRWSKALDAETIEQFAEIAGVAVDEAVVMVQDAENTLSQPHPSPLLIKELWTALYADVFRAIRSRTNARDD